jgi:peptide/nickel transport system substrate-binding protein
VNSSTSSPGGRMSLRSRINITIHSLSLSGKVIFYFLLTVFAGSTLSLLWQVNTYFMVDVPQRGGILHEGVIGLPRYVNPVLAVTDADKDISHLVYAGLLRKNPDGILVPDLAERYELSADGKVYTFVLKQNLVFSDNVPVSADDIIYTIQQIQNPAIKSPKHANWQGVIVEKVDDKTIRFTLAQAYAPFIENFTVGILPKHSWQSTTIESFALSDLNSNPIGGGPYKVRSVRKAGNGLPSSYELVVNPSYTLSQPLIHSIIFHFYPNEKEVIAAYQAGAVDSINSISPESAKMLESTGSTVYSTSLPRVFGVFFNQSENPILADHAVRQALDMSVNRDYIVTTVLQGFGTSLTGPVPERFLGDSPSVATSSSQDALVQQANSLLDKAGWTLNADGIREKKSTTGTTTLSFAISTSDADELQKVAEILKNEWKKIGAAVDVKVFEGGHLNQNVIRPRKYDALLFGQIVNRDLDLYAFWHSSQRTDPGLNIALYSNVKADKMLETVRTTSDTKVRLEEYRKFATELKTDIPAVFLYSPHFIYVAPQQVKNLVLGNLSTPSDRFNSVYNWYTNTETVWKVFAQ